MIPVLVSSSSLEAVVNDIFKDQLGSCFPSDVSSLISRLCASYNETQEDLLIDAAIKGMERELSDYSPIDMVVEFFIRLVDGYVNKETHLPVLQYEATRETIVITSRLKPKPAVIDSLIKEYRHAESRGDYLPERYRRAFEGLL